MAIGSGIGSSTGIGEEATYGTFVASTRWTEVEQAPLKFIPKRIQGMGLAQGVLAPRQTQRVQPTAQGGGQVVTPIFYKGMGLWLGQTMGSKAVPVQQGATTAYLQTHTLQNDKGVSKTIQVGVPDMTGTVNKYNFVGCKFPDVTFEVGLDQLWKMTVNVDAKDVDETNAYASPTYQTTNKPFHFGHTAAKFGAIGSEAVVAGVRSFKVTVKRGLKLDCFYLDGTGRKSEPVMNSYVEIKGTLETDFIDKTKFADLFRDDTAIPSMVLKATAVDLAGTAFPFSFELDFPDVHFDDETPTVTGPDIVKLKSNFSALYDDTNVPMTIKYMSQDTAL